MAGKVTLEAGTAPLVPSGSSPWAWPRLTRGAAAGVGSGLCSLPVVKVSGVGEKSRSVLSTAAGGMPPARSGWAPLGLAGSFPAIISSGSVTATWVSKGVCAELFPSLGVRGGLCLLKAILSVTS